MKTLIVDRKIIGWIREKYLVKDYSEESIRQALDYDLGCTDSEFLWDACEDELEVEAFDSDYTLLLKE